MANIFSFPKSFFPLGVVFFLDLFLTALSFVISYGLCSLILPDLSSHGMLIQLPIIVALSSLIFLYIGIYNGIVKADRIREVYSIFNAICLANILTIVLVVINGKLIMEEDLMVPLSIIIVHSILSFSALVASRWLYKRIVINNRNRFKGLRKAILYTEAGIPDYRIGQLKDALLEKEIEILNTIIYSNENADRVILPTNKQSKVIDNIIVCNDGDINSKILQDLVSYSSEKMKSLGILDLPDQAIHSKEDSFALDLNNNQIRGLQIEDLFPKKVNLLKNQGEIYSGFTGKTILITGAGGCIGSAYSKELFRLGIKARVILLDNSESSLNSINSFMQNSRHLEVVPKLMDIKDKKSLKDLFSTYAPSIVLHTAGNNGPETLDRNTNKFLQENVLATKVLADLAKEFGVQRFVFCSNKNISFPSTTLEVCKLLSELYLHSLDRNNNSTNFISVRIPNVVESNSSILSYMKNQLSFGKPINITAFNEYETMANVEDVAKFLVWVSSDSRFSETQVFDLMVGSSISVKLLAQVLSVKDIGYSNATTINLPKFLGEFNGTYDLSEKGQRMLHMDSPSLSKIFEKVDLKSNLKKEQIQQKIENVCLNILFYSDDYSPIFELIENFAAGEWQNLHKLHLEKKSSNKIIKLQTN